MATKEIVDKPIKFEYIFEDDYFIDTWKYDLSRHKNGPVEVTIHYKPLYTQEKKIAEEVANKSRKTRLKEIKNRTDQLSKFFK